MAMAVAENAITVPAQRTPSRKANVGLARLVRGRLLRMGLWLVFGALPVFWHDVLPTKQWNEFLSGALLLIVGCSAAAGVCSVWYELDRRFTAPGLRAGAVVQALLIFLIAWI